MANLRRRSVLLGIRKVATEKNFSYFRRHGSLGYMDIRIRSRRLCAINFCRNSLLDCFYSCPIVKCGYKWNNAPWMGIIQTERSLDMLPDLTRNSIENKTIRREIL